MCIKSLNYAGLQNLIGDAALPRIPPAQIEIGSDRAEKMLDERRDNFVWAVRRVPHAHA